jgi:hypothetical protein
LTAAPLAPSHTQPFPAAPVSGIARDLCCLALPLLSRGLGQRLGSVRDSVSAYKRVLLVGFFAAAAIGVNAAASEAQFRGRRVFAPRVLVGAYYADPYWFYDPWFGYGSGYPFSPYPHPYPPYRYDPGAAVRLDVTPDNAEVYVDGYYAGIVDDFDSVFQRLRLPPGEHEITLYLDGYRGVTQKVYLTPDHTFRLKYALARLAAGEQAEARPQPVNPPPPVPLPQPGMYPPPRRGPVGPPGGPIGPLRAEASAYGRLAIRVQPADADVLIDGEPWRSSDSQDRWFVDVAEGPHTVEIRKSGYRPYVTQVNVRRGESTPINVSLRAQDEQR